MGIKSDNAYEVKARIVEGVCRIVENGVPCENEVHDRGVCQKHRMALKRRGLLDEFAARSQKDEHTFALKANPSETECSIIEDGVPCTNEVDKRGLCSKHASRFYREGTYEKYASKSKQVYVERSRYKVKKKHDKNICRIIENDVECEEKVHSRGLCVRHRLVFDRHGLLEKYGTASQLDPHSIKVNPNAEEGVCRIIDNGVPCTRKVVNRGLCSMHRNRFYRHGTLGKYGLKPRR